MQPGESCLHCQLLRRILKALFHQTSSNIKLFLQKKCKNFERWGSTPRPLKQPLHYKFLDYAPGYNQGVEPNLNPNRKPE